ncbi:hypothetical protein NDA11_004550 [Ustilago hordei]|uniref:Conserved uncharacterized protein n=1 Tax=Ustilago hordei TaxID=120017 RepID=Q2A770_USTHO|nr:hypothetical protein NDA10_001844 [Ustilago hordei]KAJ1570823.1 hypothetical protein NDA11_004550 [Ustilago hordei]KAJ1586965.1 hypothetical protein NDA15_000514 [Ustilago hordei]KAJ1590341.1 hypothetical protein NDA12_006363 [Ustilago hordei]UTT96687.1 hypothetical protein NDA17_004162 [Ustilago hordei]
MDCMISVPSPVLAFFTEVKPAPIDLPPRFVPFIFDSRASCVMVNCPQYGKGWREANNTMNITTADGGELSTTKMGRMVSLLSFSPKLCQWEQMTYQNCLLIPDLVTNLIGTKTVICTQGQVTFEDELVTVQDKHGHVIQVPTSGDGYPTAAMIIWDNSMPEPAVSLAFATTTASMRCSPEPCSKASLWHCRLGHARHDAILCTRAVTLSHDIPLAPATHPGALCDVCIQSKAIMMDTAHPHHVEKPLELISMDVLGPLHGVTKFTYVLIVHDAYSGMTWA